MSANSATNLVRALYTAIDERNFEAGYDPASDRRQLDVFDEFVIEPEGFFEHGERVAVPVRQQARGGASGVEVEIRIDHLWTVRSGKVVRLEVFPASEDARAAAGGR